VKPSKTLTKILAGSKNVNFNDFCLLVEAFGFKLTRVNGSHHIFKSPEVNELINLQNVKGEVKPYQVSQVLKLVERYNLKLK
jgi:predicted RNA binding protein YcfA (HicA-like mRNA interferase family)